MKKDNYRFLTTGDVLLSSLTTNDFIRRRCKKRGWRKHRRNEAD